MACECEPWRAPRTTTRAATRASASHRDSRCEPGKRRERRTSSGCRLPLGRRRAMPGAFLASATLDASKRRSPAFRPSPRAAAIDRARGAMPQDPPSRTSRPTPTMRGDRPSTPADVRPAPVEGRPVRRQDHRRAVPRRARPRRGRDGHRLRRAAQGHRQEGRHQGPARRDGDATTSSPSASCRRRAPRAPSATRTSSTSATSASCPTGRRTSSWSSSRARA